MVRDKIACSLPKATVGEPYKGETVVNSNATNIRAVVNGVVSTPTNGGQTVRLLFSTHLNTELSVTAGGPVSPSARRLSAAAIAKPNVYAR